VLDKADTSFIIRRPGLSATRGSVSLESVNYPGFYLRHQNYRLKLQRDDGMDLFHQDASFFWQPPLSPGHPNAESLESVNSRGHYIRHQNYELWLAPPDAGNIQTFSQDASSCHWTALWQSLCPVASTGWAPPLRSRLDR
jgi:Alpha-L-arabinofuranosidase B (ABFB) domain